MPIQGVNLMRYLRQGCPTQLHSGRKFKKCTYSVSKWFNVDGEFANNSVA